MNTERSKPQRAWRGAATLATCLLLGCAAVGAQEKSKPFMGPKVNVGTVSCSHTGGKLELTLSDDFVVPDTPAPHWQVVDSHGNAYLLDRLVTKGDVVHKHVVVPEYVPDVERVQIWCAFAETVLGETQLECKHAAEAAYHVHKTGVFSGPKVSKGFVTHHYENGKNVLTLSDDFVVPDAPAPHWRLIDSAGRAYLLNRLTIKGDKVNRQIEIPAYVHDVAKVQIWCAWAEAVLGEADFQQPVM